MPLDLPHASPIATRRPPRVAVVGSGIAGLSAAWHLARARVHPVVFEADERLGGHARTVEVTLPDGTGADVTHGVDVGFLVFNRRTYPGLVGFFEALRIETAASEMSFSVQSPGLGDASSRLEWSGSDLGGVFAQRRNLASPRFWSMLGQIVRFNRLGTALARRGDARLLRETVGTFLARHRFDRSFRDGYLLPMVACIWSCPAEQMLEFPIGTLLRFCDNHGLLQLTRRPPWFTVRGGSRRYVDAVASELPDVRTSRPVVRIERAFDGVTVHEARAVHGQANGGDGERFDAVVLACHAPQALALLGEQATPQERGVLGAIRTQPNEAVLHTDTALMPSRRRAWAAWNFERAAAPAADRRPVCLHYWINRLQPLPFARDVMVTLNPCREPNASSVLARFEFAHPVFDLDASVAQAWLPAIQGRHRTWFAGAWCGYGFHEDGFQAGRRAAEGVLEVLGQRVARDATGTERGAVPADLGVAA